MGGEVLVVESASAADVSAVQGLIGGARRWLRSRGIDQWQDPVPDAVLLRDMEQGSLFVVRHDRDVVASVAMSDADPETWGVSASTAAYVHRLVVAQESRGAGLGVRLLAWVATRVAGRGAELVRLDCAADNSGLRSFYERQGFQHVRDVKVMSLDGSRQLDSSLYERELAR